MSRFGDPHGIAADAADGSLAKKPAASLPGVARWVRSRSARLTPNRAPGLAPFGHSSDFGSQQGRLRQLLAQLDARPLALTRVRRTTGQKKQRIGRQKQAAVLNPSYATCRARGDNAMIGQTTHVGLPISIYPQTDNLVDVTDKLAQARLQAEQLNDRMFLYLIDVAILHAHEVLEKRSDLGERDKWS
jgi:hypothetical protein